MKEIPFLQARDFRKGRRDPKTGESCIVTVVVIHTAEIGESLQGAEALMQVCAKGRPPKPDGSPNLASWHYAIDADSITQSVREEDTAFHAPGLSHCSVGIEHAGRAKQTVEEWEDAFSRAMLERSAELTAGICSRHGIPVVKLEPDDLVADLGGICGHVDVSRAFGRSSHWDPGPAFPWDWYLERVMHYSREIRSRQDTLSDTDPSELAPESA